jgi:glutamine amidotransferase
MRPDVAVVDYGMGNVGSVLRALAACGAVPVLSAEPAEIASAERLILPGVGAFGDGMEELGRRGLIGPIRAFARSGRPFLGICLGMQMMLSVSEEFGPVSGLGFIEGAVRAIPNRGANGQPHKVPHVGWNRLVPHNGSAGALLDGIGPEAAGYFVHSYAAVPNSPDHIVADCDYDGCRIAAVIRSGALYGCQFHPEKSGPVGLRILRNFLSLG